MTTTIMHTLRFQIVLWTLTNLNVNVKTKYTWKYFRTIRANQFLILVTIDYCYKVSNICSFWLKTIFSNYGSDFDLLISIIRNFISYIKKSSKCTFFEFVSILIYFQTLKFLPLLRFLPLPLPLQFFNFIKF